jgi:hypothetical protein
VFGFGMVLLFAGLRGVGRATWLECDYWFYSRGSYLRPGVHSTLRTRDRRVAMFGCELGASCEVYDVKLRGA